MLLNCCCTSLCNSQSFLTLSMDPQFSLDLQTWRDFRPEARRNRFNVIMIWFYVISVDRKRIYSWWLVWLLDSWWCTSVQNVASLYPTAMNHLAMNPGHQGFLDVAKTWIPVRFPAPSSIKPITSPSLSSILNLLWVLSPRTHRSVPSVSNPF